MKWSTIPPPHNLLIYIEREREREREIFKKLEEGYGMFSWQFDKCFILKIKLLFGDVQILYLTVKISMYIFLRLPVQFKAYRKQDVKD